MPPLHRLYYIDRIRMYPECSGAHGTQKEVILDAQWRIFGARKERGDAKHRDVKAKKAA